GGGPAGPAWPRTPPRDWERSSRDGASCAPGTPPIPSWPSLGRRRRLGLVAVLVVGGAEPVGRALAPALDVRAGRDCRLGIGPGAAVDPDIDRVAGAQ